MLRTVERNEDMSPDWKLRIHRQNDGDMQVSVVSPDAQYTTVEFCTSGGRSPKTIKALRSLMQAMDEDNADRPIST